jgi:hypothetical protein
MRIERSAIENGETIEAIAERFFAFLQPGDVIASWNKSTLELFAAEAPHDHAQLCLKTVYCNARKRTSGSLEAVVREEAIAGEATPFRGRPAKIMGALLPLVRHLRVKFGVTS